MSLLILNRNLFSGLMKVHFFRILYNLIKKRFNVCLFFVLFLCPIYFLYLFYFDLILMNAFTHDHILRVYLAST